MYNDKLSFNTDGKFRIMQIADVQEGARVSPDTLRLIDLAIRKERPELVVFTGDQIYGVHPSFYMGDKRELTENTVKTIAEAVNKHGIPFAVTFGNHDDQSGLSNAEQSDIYASFPFCVRTEYRSEDDKGSFRIPLYSEEKHIFDIYLIDSNGQSITGEYLPVSKEQIAWFLSEQEKARENGKYTNGIVFQHIPVPEFYDILKPSAFYKKGAVEAFRTHKGEFYTLPEDILKNGGFMGESPAIPDKNSGEFAALKKNRNILALIVGHDHINSFVGEKDGIRLIYTQCAGFNVYGPGLKRGVRIIELDKNDTSTFRTHTLTYGELTDEPLSAPLKEFMLTHIPTSMEQVKRLAAIGIAAGTVFCACAACYFLKKK